MTDPKRILIVGINYAPEHSGIAPYTTQVAEYLAEQGNSVEVMTGIPHYPSWKVPAEYQRRLETHETRAGVNVRRLRHFVPSSQSALKRGLYELTFGAQAFLRKPKVKPDVVLAVVPSLFSALAAARHAHKSRAKFVVWIQDSMAAAASQSGIKGGRAVSRIVSILEQAVIQRADEVIIISESFRKHVVEAGASEDRIHLVPNWTHISEPTEDRAVTRKRLGWGDNEIVALHAGNMGLKQGLETVVEAARLADQQESAVRFVLLGDGSERRRLQELGQGVHRLQFMEPVPNGDFPNVLAAADVLLVCEAPGVSDMSLPSKLTSYLAAAKPIVAAVDPHGSTARFVAERGSAAVVSAAAPKGLLAAVSQPLHGVSSAHTATRKEPMTAEPLALVVVGTLA